MILSEKTGRRRERNVRFMNQNGSKHILTLTLFNLILLFKGFEGFISKKYSAKIAQASYSKGRVEQPQGLYTIVYKVYHVAVPSGAIDNTEAPSSRIFSRAG